MIIIFLQGYSNLVLMLMFASETMEFKPYFVIDGTEKLNTIINDANTKNALGMSSEIMPHLQHCMNEKE